MPVLNFKEIPQANLANGHQDTFELFARDFFELMGFEVEVGPDRGQDDGRDLILIEKREGIIGITETRWLVSCKHKAHSGQSVQDPDENDITDRVKSHGAEGFMGFYSTIISSALNRKLKRLEDTGEIKVYYFDHEKIEKILLDSEFGRELARRFFPQSYSAWEMSNNEPANIFSQYEPLPCKFCGKDLLADRSGLIALVFDPETENPEKIEHVYWACKGVCDESLEQYYLSKGLVTGWEDIPDILIPSHFLRWTMSIMNRLRDKDDEYSNVAYEELKKFILRSSQLVVRKQSEEQIERFRTLISLPYL
ncbi:hypothetical protein CBW65_01995 [Tumebacillus avium]|uniref:Restriction endonuclease type IV Mrr domain-containing protein n=1 Tax=Tumebacillus avium TaxID=1903704 RepID=A0A1Y0IHP7_9BACL|nr:restriction endonuclease [Tumebacillus avium]ARU59968.1 hypothetical protein CBW65_01995 [Tumebacillus avium]